MTHPRFDRVIFADDFFRSGANGLHCHYANRKFLRALFETALHRLGLVAQEETALSESGTIDVERLMARLSLPCTLDGWAGACIADLSGLRGHDGMPAFGPGCLVIGWGLTPALQQCIDQSGASYLDIEIDPIRFTTHLHLCARTNDPIISAALRTCRVDEEDFWNHAAAIKGYFARHGTDSLFDARLRVGVFFGQSLVDLSLVSGGQLLHPENVLDRIRTLADSVDLLVIKPHPYEAATHHLAPIARALPNVAWTHENTYALLSASNVDFVCAVSSGVLAEARYFMKPAHALIRPDRNAADRLPTQCSEWMPVGAEIASRNFMAAICGAGGSSHAVEWPAEALDRAFATRWGLDDQSQGLHPLPQAEPGRSYAIGPDGDAAAWLSFGWTRPGPWGARMEGERACLVIPLPDDAGANSGNGEVFDLQIEGSYRLGVSASAGVLARVNGMAVPARRRSYAGPGAVEFVLQAQPHGAPGRRTLVIQFEGAGFKLKRLKVSLPKAESRRVASPGARDRMADSLIGSMLRSWVHRRGGDHSPTTRN
jgi:hypothetical protein